eukprot:jgi/Undpi1/4646/HiC_scaffold_18.g08000.m1
MMFPVSEELDPGTVQEHTSNINESKTPEVPRECPMCSLANSGGDEECRTCGSALPLDSTSDGDNCPRRESARAASSQTQQLPPGESAATAGASLEGTEDSVYLKGLAEAQRESAALAGDLEKRAAEWKQQLEKACYLSKQTTAVYRGHIEEDLRKAIAVSFELHSALEAGTHTPAPSGDPAELFCHVAEQASGECYIPNKMFYIEFVI